MNTHPSALITFLLFLFLLNTSLAQTASLSNPIFNDKLASSGLLDHAPKYSLKWGGPCVADLDNDGIYDIILSFHNRNHTRIYMGNGDGTFKLFIDPRTRRPFHTKVLDVHGVSVAPVTTRSTDRIISFSVGGGSGTKLRGAEIYIMTAKRDFKEVTNSRGFGRIKSRPRNTIFMDLQLKSNERRRREGGGPDALFVNFMVPRNGKTQFAHGNIRGYYPLVRDIGDFKFQQRGRTEVTDVDGDGKMEVVSIQQLKFYKISRPFILNDITRRVLPSRLKFGKFTVTAVAELDYDNDGDFDLYVARSDRRLFTNRGPVPGDDYSDILLRNEGGFYTDVTRSAEIPRRTDSMGVTVGDFNNDGHVDVLVVLYGGPDMILMNRGNGKFRQVNGLIPKRKGDVGNHAVGVDYNLDGRLDAIVGHGKVSKKGFGPYLLLQNRMALTRRRHYLTVTVRNDPTRAATPLHAVVTLFLRGGKRILRRVGSRGAQAGGGSYLESVHCGLGDERSVLMVSVRWTSGVQEIRRNVRANQRVFFGVL